MKHLPEEVRDKLEIYKGLLFKWQNAVNLVSRGTLREFYTRHVEDSLQLLPFLGGVRVLDVGSGGGFPGMVLAVVGQYPEIVLEESGLNGRLEVTCIDSDRKKILFLSEVARVTHSDVRLINNRIEHLEERFDTVVARGFANLKVLLEITLKHSGHGVFLKGCNIRNEISEAQVVFNFKYILHDSRTNELSKIIEVSDIERKISKNGKVI